ncbi:peptidylprolyl isomerase [Paucibacter sp. AS339]|uniref:peptidylprolyl isomerase n=1 Tax=Paucibacter hankyongi TaxID=3133434 RepID=UPI0030B6931A
MFKTTIRPLFVGAAFGALALLTACGGGGSDGGTVSPTTPKPNPVPVAPTTTCSAAGLAAAKASPMPAVVCILTSKGEIVVELESVKAPITVANFLAYVKSNYYSDTIFHRVVPGFVAQGGGFISGGTAKPGTQAAIVLENQNGLSNVRGTIAMARLASPDTATSQFYFNTVDNKGLDYNAAVSGKNGYAVFGRIISGLTVIDAINAEPQLFNGADMTATEVLTYWAQQVK